MVSQPMSFLTNNLISRTLFTNIFLFLPTKDLDHLSQSSRFFQDLIRKELLGGRLADYQNLLGIGKKQILQFAGQCKNLTKLDLSHLSNINGADLKNIGQTCPKLKTLLINSFVFYFSEGQREKDVKYHPYIGDGDEGYVMNLYPSKIAKTIPSLETLIIQDSLLYKMSTIPQVLEIMEISKEENQLILFEKECKLKYCITEHHSLYVNCDNSENFAYFNKSLCLESESEMLEEVFLDVEEGVFRVTDTIESIHILGDELISNSSALKLIFNAKRFVNVRQLFLPYFDVEDDDIVWVIHNCPLKLESLTLNGFYEGGKDRLETILGAKFCKEIYSLTLIQLDIIDDEYIQIIHNALPNLKWLKFDLVEEASANFFKLLIENKGVLPKLEKLEVVTRNPTCFKNETLIKHEIVIEVDQYSIVKELSQKLALTRQELNLIFIKNRYTTHEPLVNGNYADL